jgi:hypothetical protein
MSRRIRRDCLLTVCLSLVSIATVWADNNEPAEPLVESAIVTDAPRPPEISPEEVAREVLRLQQEMGGSIVTGFGVPATWNAPANVPTTQHEPNPVAGVSPIRALREVAWQLDQSAYLLESLDLYEQADSLRETAGKLRTESRRLKSARAAVTAPAQTLPE